MVLNGTSLHATINNDTSVAARVQWIDAAKGIGIILVVIGHSLRGLETADILSFSGVFGRIDAFIYAFHMPLMFLLSGLFMHKALPQGWLRYVLKHAQRLIWPLVLWTYIFFLCKILAGGAANSPIGWQNFPFLPLPPRAHFWFLWALFLGFLMIKGIYALGSAFKFRSISWPIVTIVTIMLVVLWVGSGFYSPWTQQALLYLPYILVGMSVRSLLFERPFYVLLGSIAVGLMTLLIPVGSTDALRYIGVAVGASGAIVSLLALFSKRISYNWLVIIGQASMAIYLSHTIVSALVRALLSSMDINDVAVHITLGIASGIVIPLIAFVAIKDERLLKFVGW